MKEFRQNTEDRRGDSDDKMYSDPSETYIITVHFCRIAAFRILSVLKQNVSSKMSPLTNDVDAFVMEREIVVEEVMDSQRSWWWC